MARPRTGGIPLSAQEEIDDRLHVLEVQQALQTEALRRIVEGKWTGADGAAGVIVALTGGQAPEGFTPLPFDEK